MRSPFRELSPLSLSQFWGPLHGTFPSFPQKLDGFELLPADLFYNRPRLCCRIRSLGDGPSHDNVARPGSDGFGRSNDAPLIRMATADRAHAGRDDSEVVSEPRAKSG